eukprot:TRINITY_DN48789_c0_g1_i1.p1 TRINITY_DN48789_c0_g1~~TRINITY_DN48789_c0_g1_i1.p1  ORF type:complete len:134 (-),score=14.23 TRINITY_DN48789_c0_g1_i1:253-624(-)
MQAGLRLKVSCVIFFASHPSPTLLLRCKLSASFPDTSARFRVCTPGDFPVPQQSTLSHPSRGAKIGGERIPVQMSTRRVRDKKFAPQERWNRLCGAGSEEEQRKQVVSASQDQVDHECSAPLR